MKKQTSTNETEKQKDLSLPGGVDLVRFEKNLLQTGFFGAHDVRHTTATIRKFETTVTREGQKIRVSVEFRSTLGLPSTIDRDKYLAFMRIATEQKQKQGGFVQNPIRFSGYRLLKELGVSTAGEMYEDINTWGKRMADTTITSEQVIYMAARKKYANKTVHVFKSFQRAGKSDLNGNRRVDHFEVELEDWLLENVNQNYVVPEDFNAYQELKRPTAKGVFGYLHLWFHGSQGREVERDYTELCQMLNIPGYRFLSKIRSTMGRALDELVAIGYVSSWDIRPMITKDGYKLVLMPGKRLLEVLAISQRKRLKEEQSPYRLEPAELYPDQVKAFNTLVELGVSRNKADDLVRTRDLDELVDELEYAQYLIRSDKRHRITNPAGFVIYAIQSPLPIPADFITSRRYKQQQEQFEAERELTELQDEYKRELREQLKTIMEIRFPGELLDRKVSEVLKERSPSDREFDEMFPKHSREMAKQLIAEELQPTIIFPEFEDWRRARLQKRLF